MKEIKTVFENNDPCLYPECKNSLSNPCPCCKRYASKGRVVLNLFEYTNDLLYFTKKWRKDYDKSNS